LTLVPPAPSMRFLTSCKRKQRMDATPQALQ
jgi:hypothetical protein